MYDRSADRRAVVHARELRDRTRLGRDDPELEPERAHTRGDGLLRDRKAELRSEPDVGRRPAERVRWRCASSARSRRSSAAILASKRPSPARHYREPQPRCDEHSALQGGPRPQLHAHGRRRHIEVAADPSEALSPRSSGARWSFASDVRRLALRAGSAQTQSSVADARPGRWVSRKPCLSEPVNGKLAYFSWYSGGFRVPAFDETGIEEVGHYIDPKGNKLLGRGPGGRPERRPNHPRERPRLRPVHLPVHGPDPIVQAHRKQ